MSRKYTDSQLAEVAALACAISQHHAARVTGISTSTIRAAMIARGLPRRRVGNVETYTTEQRANAAKLAAATSQRNASRVTGLPTPVIRAAMDALGLPRPSTVHRL